MKKKIYLILGLSVVLTSCLKKQKANISESKDKVNTNLVLENKSDSITTQEKSFSSIEDFKNFIYLKKWIDLTDEAPCHEYARSITIKDDYFNEYNGVEPSKCEIKNVKQLDSKTLEITIEDNCNYGNTFKVEILDYDQNLVKWTIFKEQTFNAKPYIDICKKTKKKEPYYTNIYNIEESKLEVDEKSKGLYYFKSNQTGKEFILDSRNNIIRLEVNGDQYGYTDQLKAVKVGDTLGLFHHKNISGFNYDEDRAYNFLKFYKSLDGKFYFEGKLPYLPNGAVEFEKVK